jgi:hypothetical protein
MLSNADVHKLYRVLLSIRSSPKWDILRLGGQRFIHVVYITGIYSVSSCKLLFLNYYYYYYYYYYYSQSELQAHASAKQTSVTTASKFLAKHWEWKWALGGHWQL